MSEGYSTLEEKMMRAVGIIRELKEVNSRLTSQRDELEAELEALKIELGRNNNEVDEARPNKMLIENFEKKRRLIEEKIVSLLAELDSDKVG